MNGQTFGEPPRQQVVAGGGAEQTIAADFLGALVFPRQEARAHRARVGREEALDERAHEAGRLCVCVFAQEGVSGGLVPLHLGHQLHGLLEGVVSARAAALDEGPVFAVCATYAFTGDRHGSQDVIFPDVWTRSTLVMRALPNSSAC